MLLSADTILGSCVSINSQIITYFKIYILRYIVNGMFEHYKHYVKLTLH